MGTKGLVAFLALLSAFVPLSTDLYLPALPTMTAYFRVPEYQTNLTLILFFVFYSLAILVWGPLSDRYGRRPILLVGLTVYAVAGVLCSVASHIYLLMFFRVLQAVGAGAASAVAAAIVKDVYRGRKRESILAVVQSMTLISPAVAPMIGAVLLGVTSWRGVFVLQAILGIAVLGGAIAFRETLQSRQTGTLAFTFGRLGVVLRNPLFASLLLVFALSGVAGMAFISSSSYIYQETFGVSSQVFSLFFALNAMGFVVGPLLYVPLSLRFRRRSIITVCFGVMMLGGVLILLAGPSGPWLFALSMLPISIALSCQRPPLVYLMLEQQEQDSGSASALMNSAVMIMGSVGMIVVSFDWGGRVQIIGVLNIVFGVLCGGVWLVLSRASTLRGASRD